MALQTQSDLRTRRPHLSTEALLHDGGATVIAAGDLVASTAPRLLAASTQILDCVPPLLVLDLRDVRFADDVGLAAILQLTAATAAALIALRVHCAGERLFDQLRNAIGTTDGCELIVDERPV
jgi:anti-anti-sigma regulatory factor